MQPVEFANLTDRRDNLIAGRLSYSPLQQLFLHRLEQLLTKRRQYAGPLPGDDWRVRLIDRSLYSTYLDCVNLGLIEEARVLLERAR